LPEKKVFIASGRDDKWVPTEKLTQYQDLAAKADIPVKLFILDHSQHLPASVAAERARARQFAKFLCED